MRIDKVKRKGDRVEIFLEGGEKLDLKLKIIEKYNISEGNDLSEDFSNKLKSDDEYSRAKDSAFRALGRRSHSISELKTKLKKKEFTDTTIESVIQDLKQSGFLDDKKFALEFYTSRTQYKKDGIQKISSQLRQRGIANSIIESIFRNHADDEIHLGNALKLTERKLNSQNYRDVEDSQKLRAKLSLYLQNKGYSYEIIREVLKKIEL